MCQDQEADAEGQESSGQRIAPRLRETRQRYDELLTTLLTVKPSAHCRSKASSAGIDDFTPNIEPLSVSHHLCEKVECSEYSWCVHNVTPLQHHRLSGPQHELQSKYIEIQCNYC